MTSFFGLSVADLIDGSSENDLIWGNGGNDTLSGGAGNDEVWGGKGNDTVNGGEGDDTVGGDAGNDSVSGDAGNDFVYGGKGNDTLSGGASNDHMTGDAGDDLIYGDSASGDDTITVPGAPETNTVTAQAFSALGEVVVLNSSLNDHTLELFQNVAGGRLNNEIDYMATQGSERVEVNFGANNVDKADVNVQLLYNNPAFDTRVETMHWDAYDNSNALVGSGNVDGTMDGNQTVTIDPTAPFAKLVFTSVDNGAGVGDYNNSDYRISTVTYTTVTPVDTIVGGGDDTIYGGSGKDTIYAGAGNDLAEGGKGDDVVYGGSGNDSLLGDQGNDKIYGDEGNDTIWGNEDSGCLTGDAGSHQMTIEFVSSISAEFKNTIGYYVKDENGNPTDGKILWADIKGVAPGTIEAINATDTTKIGFFIIPNGGKYNVGVNSGDTVTFEQIDGKWTAKVNGVALEGDETWGTTGHEKPLVYFSDASLNADGTSHVQDSPTVAGSLNWEDLYGGGDKDFNDANFNVTIHDTPSSFHITGGDTLTGGNGDDQFNYDACQDGYDTILDFLKGNDTLILHNTTHADVEFIAQGSDTIIDIHNGGQGAILLVGVNVDDAMAHTTFA